MNQEYVDIKTPEFVSLQFRPAGLGSRAAANIIDQIILLIGNVLLFVALIFIFDSDNPFYLLIEKMSSLLFATFILVLFLINWGYFFAFEYFNGGRTPGKKMMGIRVIQDNGQSITLLSSFIRNFLRVIDYLPFYYFLGMIMLFFHSKHKRIGDLVAGTIVVHERRKKGKKRSPLEKEIERRGLSHEKLQIGEWELKQLGQKEWELINTYSQRFLQMPIHQRNLFTKQIADILLPKIGVESNRKSQTELENILLILYLKLREEWDWM
ncbi:RDD family protein [Bacillus sp. FJAT-47783]|uniref:RDD family protein n=1 Tax=Bacillus sp. FJAT-47783 TaxID=2922712 RepID=UPI001FABAF90|nr:RDD family protein [Bacillus sp. FJAT-47783]